MIIGVLLWQHVLVYLRPSSPGHAGVSSNEIADELARGSSALRFVGPEPTLGVSRQNIRRNISRWLVNQHLGMVVGSWYPLAP
jgi:hypothetical protein